MAVVIKTPKTGYCKFSLARLKQKTDMENLTEGEKKAVLFGEASRDGI